MKNFLLPHLIHGRIICAILACAAIAGCAGGDRMGSAETSGMSGTAGNTASGYAGARSNDSGAMGAPAKPMGNPARKAEGMAMEQGGPDAAMAGWQGVVQAIDPITRRMPRSA